MSDYSEPLRQLISHLQQLRALLMREIEDETLLPPETVVLLDEIERSIEQMLESTPKVQ